MDFKGIQHAFPCHNDLFGLIFYRQTSYQRCNFFGSLPFSQLPKTFLPRPDTCMDDLQKELSGFGIKDEDCAVDRFSRQVTFKSFVDSNSVYISVINKPDDLVWKQLSVILRIQVWLSWFAWIQLQTFPDSFTQHIQGGICFHNLVHGLLEQLLATMEPISETTVQVVSQIDGK